MDLAEPSLVRAGETFPSLKRHFSRALQGGAGKVHLAAHSHHLWPDVSFAAHCAAWQDAATLWDAKWSRVLGEILPQAQRHIARHLNLGDPTAIAFAPNTHDLLRRVLSCLPAGRTPRLLATDGEFHSAARQFARLEEDGLLAVERVPVEPVESFETRFAQAAARGGHDLVFVSQVFFASGFRVLDLAALVRSVPDSETLIVIDGYHGFMAVPTDLAPIAARAFYIAGGYKYAMAGEGACFLVCPPGIAPRPRDTGWYAAPGELAGAPRGVAYAEGGMRFAGATFDPTPLYRLVAVMDWLRAQDIEVDEIHARARANQAAFAQALDATGAAGFRLADLALPWPYTPRGNFLAYRVPDAEAAHLRLLQAGIVCDRRSEKIRFGFGLYHDPADMPALAARVARVLRPLA